MNHSLIANFVQKTSISMEPALQPGGEFSIKWPIDPPGWILEESADLSPDSWMETLRAITTDAVNHSVTVDPNAAAKLYFRLSLPQVP